MAERRSSAEMIHQVWPEWTCGRRIGRGSFGEVFEVKRGDLGFESRAAVKVILIPPDESEPETLRLEGMSEDNIREYYEKMVDSFAGEIRLMESLKGAPHIVALEDFSVVENREALFWTILIRMELLTPFQSFVREHPLTEDDTIRLGIELCTALDVCHRQNIIHRDIKPQNIFVDRFGSFKLGDFGIARKMEGMTSGMSRKGTYGYIAPEVSHSLLYDTRADIYSLGLVMYQQVNGGRLPFLENQQQMLNPKLRAEAVSERLSGKPLPPPSSASPELTEIIVKACRFEQGERFRDTAEMLAALRRLSLIRSGYEMTEAGIRHPARPDPDRLESVEKTERIPENAVSPEPDEEERTVTVRDVRQPSPETGTSAGTSGKKGKGQGGIKPGFGLMIILTLLATAALVIPLLQGKEWFADRGGDAPTTVQPSEADDSMSAGSAQTKDVPGYTAWLEEFESCWEPVYTTGSWKNWTKKYSWGGTGTVTVLSATSQKPASLEIHSDNPEHLTYGNTFKLEKNTIYRVRADIKVSDFKRYRSADERIYTEPVGCTVYRGGYADSRYYHQFVRSDDWTRSSLIFNSGNNPIMEIGIMYGNANGHCSGTAWVKDFVLEKYTGDPEILFGSSSAEGYAKAWDAASAIGTKMITTMSFLKGSPQYYEELDQEASSLFDGKPETKFFTDTIPCTAWFRLSAAHKISGIIFRTATDHSIARARLPYLWTLFGVDQNNEAHEIHTGDASVFNNMAGGSECFSVRIDGKKAYDTYVLKIWGTPSGLFQMADVYLCIELGS